MTPPTLMALLAPIVGLRCAQDYLFNYLVELDDGFEQRIRAEMHFTFLRIPDRGSCSHPAMFSLA